LTIYRPNEQTTFYIRLLTLL